MIKAHFIFTKLTNSFKVDIPNLENLSVEQIQEIEKFVKDRKGIFNFNTYSFIIQKNLEYNDFVKLIDKLKIHSECGLNIAYAEPATRIGFGQYKGMFITDVPDSYLLWLKNNYSGEQKQYILDEINLRKL